MTKKKTQPRQSWDEYFYSMAELVASRSRDESPVGAVIVGDDHVVTATGYNGLPRLVTDSLDRLEKSEKLKWTVHAESNVICNAARVGVSTKNSTMYVTKFPCAECTGKLIQAGIVKIFTKDDHFWNHDTRGDDGSRTLKMLSESGIAVIHNIPIGQIKNPDLKIVDSKENKK